MEITWKQITKQDRELITAYYEKEQPMACELTFGNNILWSPFFGTKFAIIEDMLVFLSSDEKSISFPQGKEHVEAALEKLFAYFQERKLPFRMTGVTQKQFEQLEELFPGQFEIAYDRDAADYIYEAEKLRTLSGSKLHGKRNHINKFKETYPDWSYEPITEENKAECFAMAEEWWKINGEEDRFKKAEFEVTKRALTELEQLGFVGGLLRADGKVVAFSIGEKASEETFVVHIEKAYGDIQGAYPMINQQFVLHEMGQYTYVNREEDAGVEGLRKAKLSYRPVFLLEKGIVTIKKELCQ